MARQNTKTRTARTERLAEYEKAKRLWRKHHQFCTYPGCQRPAARSPHHIRGRLGALLCDIRFWVALCWKHHNWVHNNPDKARALNLYAQYGEWNVPVP